MMASNHEIASYSLNLIQIKVIEIPDDNILYLIQSCQLIEHLNFNFV